MLVGLRRDHQDLSWRVTVLHAFTYLVVRAISYLLIAKRYWTGLEAVPGLRDPESQNVQDIAGSQR